MIYGLYHYKIQDMIYINHGIKFLNFLYLIEELKYLIFETKNI